MRLLAALALLLLVAGMLPARAGDRVFSDPQPSMNHPRRVVMSLSERDPVRVNEVISNVGNVQKFYGADNVRIALVVYGPGIHALLKDESTVKARIAGLLAIDVEVLACSATLESLHRSPHDLLDGVKTVPNGLPEIVERQVRGWFYVHP